MVSLNVEAQVDAFNQEKALVFASVRLTLIHSFEAVVMCAVQLTSVSSYHDEPLFTTGARVGPLCSM